MIQQAGSAMVGMQAGITSRPVRRDDQKNKLRALSIVTFANHEYVTMCLGENMLGDAAQQQILEVAVAVFAHHHKVAFKFLLLLDYHLRCFAMPNEECGRPVVQTAGEPPITGSTILAKSGWTKNRSDALRKIVSVKMSGAARFGALSISVDAKAMENPFLFALRQAKITQICFHYGNDPEIPERLVQL